MLLAENKMSLKAGKRLKRDGMEDDDIRKTGNDCVGLADVNSSGRELLQVYFYHELLCLI